MVDIVFLGTGGAFSAGRRGNLGLLIEKNDFRMLVEAGPPIMQQLARNNIRAADVGYLFISHYHGDHGLGFPMLVLKRIDAPTQLHVYAGHTTVMKMKALWELVYPGFDVRRLNIRWHRLSEQGLQEAELVEGIILRTAPVPYPPGIPTLAARWDFVGGPSVTFATDTTPGPATVELASGSALLIHEASFSAVLQPGYDPATYSHSTAQQAGEVARQAGCLRLALVHLGPEIGEHPDVLAEEARAGTDLEVIVPEDDERLRLS